MSDYEGTGCIPFYRLFIHNIDIRKLILRDEPTDNKDILQAFKDECQISYLHLVGGYFARSGFQMKVLF